MSVLTRLLRPIVATGRRSDRGAASALVALALLPITAVTAVGVDAGRVFVERQRIQTAAEAGALAVASQWFRTGVACGAEGGRLVAANAGDEASETCATSGTRFGGIVTVAATKDVDAMFDSIVGRSTSVVASTASVRIGPADAVSGLRPTALCEHSPAIEAWRASGFSTTQQFTVGITGDCGGVPGNWGVLDFDGGSNPTTDLQRWIDQGWSGTVRVGQEFSGDPGIPSPALRMDSVIGRVISVPVYDRVRYEGSNSIYRVSSFVTMEVVSVQLSGSSSSRNVVVRFATATVGGPGGAAPNMGTVALQPCSLDGKGVCS